MTTLEINATEEETFVELPAGEVVLTTSHPVVFWCAAADPSVRAKDYRTELQRLHAGSPRTLGGIPEGWKLAISTRADLPALHTKRPPKPTPPADPGPTAEELAERLLARQFAKDMERADLLNEAMDLILARIQQPAAPAYVDLSERADPVEEVVGPLEALKAKIDAVRAGQQELTPDELLQMYRDDPPGAAAKLEDAVRALKGEARRKLSELLNVELAELKNLRGMAGEDREREQQIEYLLGLFTRLGEI